MQELQLDGKERSGVNLDIIGVEDEDRSGVEDEEGSESGVPEAKLSWKGFKKFEENAPKNSMEQAIADVLNKCCPFLVRLHRVLDPLQDNWQARCTARAVGVRWKHGVPQLMCEWPIGSGVVYTQSTLAFKFVEIYRIAAKVYTGEIRHPNAWRELIAQMRHVDEEDSGDEEWMRLEELLPKDIRDKDKHYRKVNTWLKMHQEEANNLGTYQGLPEAWIDPSFPNIPDIPDTVANKVKVNSKVKSRTRTKSKNKDKSTTNTKTKVAQRKKKKISITDSEDESAKLFGDDDDEEDWNPTFAPPGPPTKRKTKVMPSVRTALLSGTFPPLATNRTPVLENKAPLQRQDFFTGLDNLFSTNPANLVSNVTRRSYPTLTYPFSIGEDESPMLLAPSSSNNLRNGIVAILKSGSMTDRDKVVTISALLGVHSPSPLLIPPSLAPPLSPTKLALSPPSSLTKLTPLTQRGDVAPTIEVDEVSPLVTPTTSVNFVSGNEKRNEEENGVNDDAAILQELCNIIKNQEKEVQEGAKGMDEEVDEEDDGYNSILGIESGVNKEDTKMSQDKDEVESESANKVSEKDEDSVLGKRKDDESDESVEPPQKKKQKRRRY